MSATFERQKAQILDALSVDQVYGAKIELHPCGGNYKGCCCFHRERDPSVFVYADDKHFHCYGCGKHGSAFDFVMEVYGLDFQGALRHLASLAGIPLDGTGRKGANRTKNHAALITVEALARDKLLPVEFLRSLGLKDTDRGVQIPYFFEDSAPAARHRIRAALRAGDGSYWETDARVIVPYGLQKLAEARGAGFLVIVEGESDSWTLWHHGFPCLGIPGASHTKCLLPKHIVGIEKIFIVQEPGNGGSAFVDGLRKRFVELHWEGEARVVSLHPQKDPNELHKVNPEMFPESFYGFLDGAQPLTPDEGRATTVGIPSRNANPWTCAVGMAEFLSGEDEPVEFLHNGMIAKGAITEIFSPRGLGKSLWATFVAVLLARNGLRVMLIDRDNSRRTVKERLRGFGATMELTALKFLSRENAPPLTDAKAWAEFPYLEYDAIFLDSLDSSAEGVGEQDSSKPSKAIAPLLDIARREDGPAVLVLGNCVRTAARSRGSGVVEDRADIVFEVRDATDFHASGTKPWIEELPAGGADHWAARSSRRKRREKYRLAFIATKFRIGEEPDPFVLEIDLTAEPWIVRDVTAAVDAEGCAAREQREKEYADAISRGRASLIAELFRRQEAQEPIILKEKDAVPYLMKCGMKRNAARKLLDEPASKIPAEILPHIRAAKLAILEILLRSRTATCAASCYQIDAGRWIHHPWNGCTTIQPKADTPLHKVQETCWHCRGEKECGCIVCWQAGPSECSVCRGSGQMWRWVQ